MSIVIFSEKDRVTTVKSVWLNRVNAV